MKKIINWIKNNKTWSIIICLVIIGLIWYGVSSQQNSPNFTLITAEKGTIKEEVSVTGNVKPFSDVNLAFERGGKVSSVFVSTGDQVYTGQTLASLSNADLVANLAQAEANLKITKLQLGTKTNKADLDLTQSELSLVNTIKDSYTKADDAVRNKMYSLFIDPIKYNATLSFSADKFLQEDIEDGKDEVSDALDAWYQSMSRENISANLETQYNLAKTNLLTIKKLLDKTAEAVNGLSPSSSFISQTQIDTWKLNISTARSNIDLAITTLTTAYDQYETAKLGVINSKTDLSIQGATIEQAIAGVASAEAELNKSFLRSPINGVVTNLDVKIGEIVPANKNIISVISYGDYEVESYIPEADISKIKIGNLTRTTLDAYGDSIIFETRVIKIDPAATIIDGVPTYKVTFKFTNKDDRIRPGMTANLDIQTNEKKDVVIVPARAIISEDGKKYINILITKDDLIPKRVEVTTGLRGIDGFVEIMSGITPGDLVITNNTI